MSAQSAALSIARKTISRHRSSARNYAAMLCDWRAHFLPVASGISFDPSLERSRFLKRNQKLVRYVQKTHPCELLRRRLELNLEIDRFGRIHV
jgi:hypothetical protein